MKIDKASGEQMGTNGEGGRGMPDDKPKDSFLRRTCLLHLLSLGFPLP